MTPPPPKDISITVKEPDIKELPPAEFLIGKELEIKERDIEDGPS